MLRDPPVRDDDGAVEPGENWLVPGAGRLRDPPMREDVRVVWEFMIWILLLRFWATVPLPVPRSCLNGCAGLALKLAMLAWGNIGSEDWDAGGLNCGV